MSLCHACILFYSSLMPCLDFTGSVTEMNRKKESAHSRKFLMASPSGLQEM